MTPLTVNCISSLTVPELWELVHGELEVPQGHREPKAKLAEYIISNGLPELHDTVKSMVLRKEREREQRRRNQKCKQADGQATQRQRA